MGSNASKIGGPPADFCENNVIYMLEKYPGSCDKIQDWKDRGFNGRLGESSLRALRNRITDAETKIMSRKYIKPKDLHDIKTHFKCLEMWESAAEERKQVEKMHREKNLKDLKKIKGPFQEKVNATDDKTNTVSSGCFPSLTQPVGPLVMSEEDDNAIYPHAALAAAMGRQNQAGGQSPPPPPLSPPPAAHQSTTQPTASSPSPSGTTAVKYPTCATPQPPPYDCGTLTPSLSPNNPFTAPPTAPGQGLLRSGKSYGPLFSKDVHELETLQLPMVEFPNPIPPPAAGGDNNARDEHPPTILMYRSPDPEKWTRLIKDNIPPLTRGGAIVGEKFRLFCQIHRPTGAEIPAILRSICTLEEYAKIQTAVEDATGMNSQPTITWGETTPYGLYVTAIVTELTRCFPARMDMANLVSLKRADNESVMSFAARARQHCAQYSGLATTAWTAAETSPFEEMTKLVLKNGLGRDIVKIMTDKMVGTWENNRMTDLLRYAEDAEARCTNKKDKADAKMISTFVKMNFGQTSEQETRGRGRGRGQGRRGGKNRVRLDRNELDRRRRGDLCFVCGEPGHWANECTKKGDQYGDGGARARDQAD